METISYPAAHEAQTSGRLTIFLHGFPGIRSKQNRELAEIVARETRVPSEVVLYPGLGCAGGVFSFGSCRDDVCQFIQAKLEAQPDLQLDLVGHSWGGYLSLTLTQLFPSRVRRLILLSPLLEFVSAGAIRPWLEQVRSENPAVQLSSDLDRLALEFAAFQGRAPASKLIAAIPNTVDVLFLQARIDPMTPAEIAQAHLPNFHKPPTFALVDNDHSFLADRPALGRRLAEFLKDPAGSSS